MTLGYTYLLAQNMLKNHLHLLDEVNIPTSIQFFISPSFSNFYSWVFPKSQFARLLKFHNFLTDVIASRDTLQAVVNVSQLQNA